MRPWQAWALLVLGVLGSVYATLEVRREIEREARQQFTLACDQVVVKLRERLDAYALILRGAAGLFGASDEVARGDWRSYVDTLQAQRSVPGVQGIGYAQLIPAAGLGAHQAAVRAEGFPAYAVRPAGPRAVYSSIVYLEPFSGRNLRAFGYDMYAEPVRRAAMDLARDSGEAALSGKVELVQETGQDVQAGVLMYMPVYRSAGLPATAEQRRYALRGWAYSPYRMNDLMQGVLADWPQREGRGVGLRVYDGDQVLPERLLFDSLPTAGHDTGHLLQQTRMLHFHGRPWSLSFDAEGASFVVDYSKAWFTLGAGLALTSLLWALMRSLIHTRANAMRIAGRLTEETRRREELLRESETFKAAILDSVSVAIAVLDAEGVILAVNEPWRRLAADFVPAARQGAEPPAVGSQHLDLYRRAALQMGKPEAAQATEGLLSVLEGRATRYAMEYPSPSQDGLRWTDMTVNRLDHAGVGAVVTYVDITDRKRVEEQLQQAASVFSHAREGIMITELDGTIIDVNEAFTRITGYGRDEVLGANPRMLQSGHHGDEHYAAMWEALRQQGHWLGETWNRRKSGEVFVEMQTISTVCDAEGRPRHYVSLFSDITAQKANQAQLERVAHNDALTGLPNRVLLADRLRHGLLQAQRRDQLLAVVFLDLDGFKQVNDAHGHEVGDQLLVSLAKRMRQALRETDTLARLGGDEFVAVLGDLTDTADAVPVLDRVLAAAALPVPLGGQLLQVSASLGVTFFPQAEEVDAEQLIRQADQAMYQAKQAGRNRYVVFDAEQHRHLRGHLEDLDRLREALQQDEFVLHFQPQVHMRRGTVVGVEALIRWQHPVEGLLPPGAFLPQLEGEALRVELGEWVIRRALAHMQVWQAQGLLLSVSVNVGADQLQHPEFVDRLRQHLADHPDVPPARLSLEVLESSALRDLAQMDEVIQACRGMGVHFALDDFGTGYSSLTYLKQLAVARIKIDRSFVRGMLHDPEDLAILQGVLGLARSFRREVIAEGVESVAHGHMLLRLGCELAQGFGIARPMPADALAGWLQSWQQPPEWAQAQLVGPDDRPLLLASVEHAAWLRALLQRLEGGDAAFQLPGSSACPVGAWLHEEGPQRYGRHPAFAGIDGLHQQLHRLADELLDLHARGDDAAVRAGLPRLQALSGGLQRLLMSLA